MTDDWSEYKMLVMSELTRLDSCLIQLKKAQDKLMIFGLVSTIAIIGYLLKDKFF